MPGAALLLPQPNNTHCIYICYIVCTYEQLAKFSPGINMSLQLRIIKPASSSKDYVLLSLKLGILC